MAFISVVAPVYNEEGNLELLVERLNKVADSLPQHRFEYIFVDDASTDRSPQILRDLCDREPRVKMIRFSRNCRSHAATIAGLRHASGDLAVIIAADLQDPPEMIPRLLEARQKEGAAVVWASRARREGESLYVRGMSRVYWWAVNRLTPLNFHSKGADVCLLERRVVDALLQSPEKHGSMFMLIAWLGFPQTSIEYVKEARHSGETGWTFRHKVKLFLDSIFSFSSVPIRAMLILGLTTAVVGFGFAIEAAIAGIRGESVPGWASLTIAVLVIGGVQMVMLGILGEYIWRTFDESRRRPFYIVESWKGFSRKMEVTSNEVSQCGPIPELPREDVAREPSEPSRDAGAAAPERQVGS